MNDIFPSLPGGTLTIQADPAAPDPVVAPVVAPDPAPQAAAQEAQGEPAAPAASEAEQQSARVDWKERAIREEERRQALERQLAEAREAAAKPAQQQPQAPDPNADPQGYAQWAEAERVRQARNEKLDEYEEAQRDAHGDEKVDAALAAYQKAVAKNPAIQAEVEGQRNPWRYLMKNAAKWAAEQEIGDDPAGFRARIEAETREKVMAEMAAAPPAAPAARQPPNLTGLANAAPRGVVPPNVTPPSNLFPPQPTYRSNLRH